MRRRHFVCALPAALLASRARGAAPARVVSLDWGLTEMLLSLGIVPVGAANPGDFRRAFTVCRLPADVVDVGLIYQPNLELLLALAPDLIVISPSHARLRGTLERIAPTLTLGRYPYTHTPYPSACAETRQMAARFGRGAQADAVIAQADAAIARSRDRLASHPGLAGLPVIAATFVDETHLRIAGGSTLYGDIIARLGLREAAQVPGAAATVGMDALSRWPDATLVCLQPVPPPARRMMARSRLWRALPMSRPGRFLPLPVVPPSGGVRTAAYFAERLAAALLETPAATGKGA